MEELLEGGLSFRLYRRVSTTITRSAVRPARLSVQVDRLSGKAPRAARPDAQVGPPTLCAWQVRPTRRVAVRAPRGCCHGGMTGFFAAFGGCRGCLRSARRRSHAADRLSERVSARPGNHPDAEDAVIAKAGCAWWHASAGVRMRGAGDAHGGTDDASALQDGWQAQGRSCAMRRHRVHLVACQCAPRNGADSEDSNASDARPGTITAADGDRGQSPARGRARTCRQQQREVGEDAGCAAPAATRPAVSNWCGRGTGRARATEAECHAGLCRKQPVDPPPGRAEGCDTRRRFRAGRVDVVISPPPPSRAIEIVHVPWFVCFLAPALECLISL
jgi:hypothetical protein